MRHSGLCCRRLLRSCSSGRGVVVGGQRRRRVQKRDEVSPTCSLYRIEREADDIASQLLKRHRKRCASKTQLTGTQEQEEWRSHASVGFFNRSHHPDVLAGYGKKAMLLKLAHMCDVNEVGTQELLQTTDKEWDALTPDAKLSAAFVGANGRPDVLREIRSNSSTRPRKTTEMALSPFDTVLQRYAAVVPESGTRSAVGALCSWQVNMPTTLTRKSTVRGLLARRELLERHNEWQRVRNHAIPSGNHFAIERADKKKASSQPSSSTFSSPMFRRYCLEFGSNTLGRAAFLTEPTTYYVLRNLRPTDGASLLEVRSRAEELSRQYDSVRLS